ncbi:MULTISPECIES: lipopolysaccharide assembly protein LapB [unclassified Undibacterium]|uniref:lipopolysaccharide assembly protein LapB n=1 Tax=unclassified Undibacterium TaxID=2630295 RepID=UPI002AC93BCA|nr:MULTISPECIES: lipopolysaccharide assembly protein LapB [unclassified Undibacterium]MEB0139561.1 lipopolysaccharide assembly protein LapB [Undibacterium sp. CCC2.1]MEB0172508.1 lipopolysaccharide assembly protein LapB [Undibacterium sp. CCC1.1]MEB0176526.1 lipopolysaccharide assembly protein LapB [Undibacterium sp. CCC3.4]MEB0215620.1 lipopolysaccharide assembly protein LapB [Undibacterium sp. 5I2]WPX43982.1 lipopolysaccharide assembly protein LapB [Undibacterium sp. CCC3.4]
MEFEIWWLLGIPLFFTLGWLAARVDIRQLLSESRSLPNGYFKGLNFLLNEQPDKAIDAFIEIVRLDPEAVELHFALGILFRRRGETERAIRVHQNMLARPDLPAELKTQACYELGQDYLKAGLLDRAEETFNLLLSGNYEAQARRALLEIYQREKEWARAIEAAHALQEAGAGGRQKEIAQFYCEIAQDELVHTNSAAALASLDKALATDRMNVRATMLIGDVQLANGEIEQAVLTWRRVEQQSVPHVALVAQRLMDGYRKLERPQEGLNLLKNYLAEAPSVDLLEVAFKATLELDTVEAANVLVSDELRRTPTLLGLDKLLDARMLNVPNEFRPELALVKNLVHGYAQKLARYQCSHCGFKARQFYWHCPGCSRWETYPPRRTEELNVMN